MHRHGYKQSKLSRPRDQRRILIRNLADRLIVSHSLTTTLPRAKAVRPYVERLITKAKKGDLHNRRIVISRLGNVTTGHMLVDHLSPQLQGRSSGYLRIEKLGFRRGDHAPMARLSFVDKLLQKGEKEEKSKKAETATASQQTEPAAKDKDVPAKPKTKAASAANAKAKRQAKENK